MQNPVKYMVVFFIGAVFTVALIALTGTLKPEAAEQTEQHVKQAKQFDTQMVSLAGGLAVLLVVHDHDNHQLYMYDIPGKEEEGVQLKGQLDLSTVGEQQISFVDFTAKTKPNQANEVDEDTEVSDLDR